MKGGAQDPTQMTFDFEHKDPALLDPVECFRRFTAADFVRVGETHWFDRKSARIDPRAVGETCSAFANTRAPGGVIAVGIEKDGTLNGFRGVGPAKEDRLLQAPRTFCAACKSETRNAPFKHPDGVADHLLLIHVEYDADRLVETSDGNAYVRVGTSNHRLSSDERRELQAKKGQIRDELQPAVDLDFDGDLDAELLEQFRRGWHRYKEPAQERTVLEALEIEHLLIRKNDRRHVTIACAILFAKDPRKWVPGAYIRFRRFEGTAGQTGRMLNVVKDHMTDGPIPRQIRQLEGVLKGQLRDFSFLGDDGKFMTVPEYPPDAWYEAIVNAVVHRSYTLSTMNVFVDMYDDRLEIESPGAFPGVVNPKNIYYHHVPRNPVLMHGMFYIGFVHMAREGVRRMRDEMLRMKLPEPRFEEQAAPISSVKVTLRNNIEHRRSWLDTSAQKHVGEAVFSQLTDDEKAVCNYVAEHGSINVSQASRICRNVRDWGTVKRMLLGLVTRGILAYEHQPGVERDPKAHFQFPNSPRSSRNKRDA